MRSLLRGPATRLYETLLEWELSGTPDHVAVIQDGNRRYARKQGEHATDGHREGAQTTEAVLQWCEELGIEELTLYAFSTENFERPPAEREALFDLLETKLREFADADRVHEAGVRIRAIGEIDRLPERVQDAVAYADRRTRSYDQFQLNVALAYGGRAELLNAARGIAQDVRDGDLDPDAVDVETVDRRLYDGPTRDVDLIIRTGGDERTSNFLPWHANGNEAAVYFCAPYWPEFRKIDLLRAIRTYESREASWRTTRVQRALALVRAIENERGDGGQILERLRERLPREQADALSEQTDVERPAD
ncbi:polyprenyl diphosphate synthase [Halapricum hydrolyticum]|uniref:Tritrans,polycis-undecaprenyl-diphosphate synthase (geranylgeranyl-diphosphate specific) n=1 Tax=Halapricum hydrolyticum TaxID=2979991 RepID=A0AAE3IBK6_9EURY|nr:polyprenyl diphosphate synthase [Halapricum hydrolyticum]MCU4716930.1 polyprenyl diphosphate synthase [Halapricum hydrolyticum]MCU4725465.1 polyprenyl diphosphate synthase [Halapricum hydrolyticum]